VEHAIPAITAVELNDWLAWQLERLDAWQATVDPAWLRIETGNPAFPVLAALLDHAYSPVHRYSDRVLGVEPVTPESLAQAAWPEIHAWAKICLARHREACLAAEQDAERLLQLPTRSMGTLTVSVRHALAQAATHCLWHLAGIAHLLRQAGIAPPQTSELIFWAAEHQ
jgi:uncharacterized damage-inducible protein DinB